MLWRLRSQRVIIIIIIIMGATNKHVPDYTKPEAYYEYPASTVNSLAFHVSPS